MATPSGLLRAYNHCLAETQRVLGRLGYQVHQASAHMKPNGDILEIYLDTPLYFERWPFKSQTNRHIHILAEVKETLRLQDGMCIKSSVAVNYFLVSGEVPVVCDAIKYDYDHNVQPQHPICHAQNSNTVIDDRPEIFPRDFDQKALEHRHQALRIPTAFVNLADLIEKLTADHLPPGDYDEFWEKCQKYVDAIPCHARCKITGSISASNSIRSRHWYPRS